MDSYSFDVFLSHNSRDKAHVVELKRLLQARGLRCWLDKDELPPGQNWIPLLDRGLNNSKAIAVCVGSAGQGPWQDEETQSALRKAVSEQRAVIPVLLPGVGRQPVLPDFLANRTWVDLSDGFGDAGLVHLVWGITGVRADEGDVGGFTDTGPEKDPMDDPDLPNQLQEVFGHQYDAIATILEYHTALRDVLIRRCQLSKVRQSNQTAALFYHFHARFLQALGIFGALYRESRDARMRADLLELVSYSLYLAIAPEHAAALKEQGPTTEIRIARAGRQGVADILLAWTRGRDIVDVRGGADAISRGAWETVPKRGLADIKEMLLQAFGITGTGPAAEEALARKLETEYNFQTPVTLVLDEEDQHLVDQIRAPDSPLRHLLLFIRSRDFTINPRARGGYDQKVDEHIAKFREIIDTPT
jgi:hypothetical protein